VSAPCPACGKTGDVFLSESRSAGEEALRSFLPVGYFNCQACGWRGKGLTRESFADWLLRVRASGATGLLIVLLVLVLLASAYHLATVRGPAEDAAPPPPTPRAADGLR
jgi:sensor histidine kinase regulating citrate/malate metabolism